MAFQLTISPSIQNGDFDSVFDSFQILREKYFAVLNAPTEQQELLQRECNQFYDCLESRVGSELPFDDVENYVHYVAETFLALEDELDREKDALQKEWEKLCKSYTIDLTQDISNTDSSQPLPAVLTQSHNALLNFRAELLDNAKKIYSDEIYKIIEEHVGRQYQQLAPVKIQVELPHFDEIDNDSVLTINDRRPLPCVPPKAELIEDLHSYCLQTMGLSPEIYQHHQSVKDSYRYGVPFGDFFRLHLEAAHYFKEIDPHANAPLKKRVEEARLQVYGTIEVVAYNVFLQVKDGIIARVQNYDKIVARTLTSFLEAIMSKIHQNWD